MIPFKSPVKKQRNIEVKRNKIIVDYREKNSLVSAILIENKQIIQFENLDIGDYLLEGIIIERKTYSDFVSSMINKRIFQQLEEIKKFPEYFLIIEGDENQINSDNLKKSSKGLILSIITKYKIPIIFTKNEKETAEILIMLANKREKSSNSIRPSHSIKSLEEQKQFILEGFPQIGPKTAKDLLEKFKKLKLIFNAPEQELKEILGKKYEKFKEILES